MGTQWAFRRKEKVNFRFTGWFLELFQEHFHRAITATIASSIVIGLLGCLADGYTQWTRRARTSEWSLFFSKATTRDFVILFFSFLSKKVAHHPHYPTVLLISVYCRSLTLWLWLLWRWRKCRMSAVEVSPWRKADDEQSDETQR